jgi:hypothetical protein
MILEPDLLGGLVAAYLQPRRRANAVVRRVGTGRGTEFRLFVPGLSNPPRRYVEDRLGCKEVRAVAMATRRFHRILRPALIRTLTGVIAIWPLVRNFVLSGR